MKPYTTMQAAGYVTLSEDELVAMVLQSFVESIIDGAPVWPEFVKITKMRHEMYIVEMENGTIDFDYVRILGADDHFEPLGGQDAANFNVLPIVLATLLGSYKCPVRRICSFNLFN